jgi:hypothetical protein
MTPSTYKKGAKPIVLRNKKINSKFRAKYNTEQDLLGVLVYLALNFEFVFLER